jgi:SAM-dependent methyltransferase
MARLSREGNGPHQAYVRMPNGRLALYRPGQGEEHWERAWEQLPGPALQRALRPTSNLGHFGPFFRRWLPRQGLILDAGCGFGLWVSRLRQNGYRTLGLDAAWRGLMRAHEVRRDLPLLVGDVLALPFPDESVSAYLSLGVIEHFEHGPRQALGEAARVLQKGGVALISVPHRNRLRSNLPLMDRQQAEKSGLRFYQQYFTRQEIAHELAEAGLEPGGAFHGYGVGRVLCERWPLAQKLLGAGVPLARMLDRIPFLGSSLGHMILTVAFK